MSSRPSLRVLCAPYHLYTHHDVLDTLFPPMVARGWEVSILLPFTAAATLEKMAGEARAIGGVGRVIDYTSRRLAGAGTGGAARMLRALALLLYFVRTGMMLAWRRPDALLLTSDLGGVSVRFVQLLCQAMGVSIFTIQTTLFLRVAEREDLKFAFRPQWLHRLLSRGLFQRLFLYFGEVPGSFLAGSHLAVQDDGIRDVCMEFGKDTRYIAVVGSLQAAKIRAARAARPGRQQPGALPHVLFLSECIGERYGEALGVRYIDWMRASASALQGRATCSVRFHPRESLAYREHFMAQLGALCRLDGAANAVAAAAHADVVVGAFSMLMFDAQAAGIGTVFLEVGEDPIGFYSARRTPRADSAAALHDAILETLHTPAGQHGTAAASPRAWADALLEWISRNAK